MDISNQEEGMPMPISSTYGGGHGHGHGHLVHHIVSPNPIVPSTAPQMLSNGPSMLSNLDDHGPYKKAVKYKECLKNHAAVMGGNATDGCGEFMPSGEEGTIEALTCLACNCHRNFHRKEVEGEPSYDMYRVGRKVILGHHKNIMGHHESLVYPSGSLIPSRGGHAAAPHQMIMPYSFGSLPSESDEQEDGDGVGGVVARPPPQLVKKRFRTKFTKEQKEEMFNFAEKVGWKIQKQEEAVVQQFCQEIGIKRRVLKVWMHNNKHNLAKKNNVLPNA